MNHPIMIAACLGAGAFILSTLVSCDASPPAATLCAPDHIAVSPDKKLLLLADHEGSRILMIAPETQTIVSQRKLPSPAVDMVFAPDGTLWVTCEGPEGRLLKLASPDLKIINTYAMGPSPAALAIATDGQTIWIAQRNINEVWAFDAVRETIARKMQVGREPVYMLSLPDTGQLLVAHNLPAQSATDFPIAAELRWLNPTNGSSRSELLPNGSTDVRALISDPEGKYAYASHLISRYQLPTNQVDRGWMSTNALSIIDLKNGKYLTTVLLDAPQKGAANPAGLHISENGQQLLVALTGTGELAVIDLPSLHERLEQARRGEKVVPSFTCFDNIPNDTGFLHGLRRFIPTLGKGPRTVAMLGKQAYAANYFTGELVHWNTLDAKPETTRLGKPLTSTPEGLGNMYFHDATLSYQGWQSCASCHPNGARLDGFNWDLLNDGAGNPKNTKSLINAHKTPPCMVTGIRKNAETAVRSGMKHILFTREDEPTAQAIDAYLSSLSTAKSPYLIDGKPNESALRGKAHFDQHCTTCHTAPLYTNGQQYTVSWATGNDKTIPMDVPSLKELWRSAPYLYDGRAATLDEVLNIHNAAQNLTPQQKHDLVNYLLTL